MQSDEESEKDEYNYVKMQQPSDEHIAFINSILSKRSQSSPCPSENLIMNEEHVKENITLPSDSIQEREPSTNNSLSMWLPMPPSGGPLRQEKEQRNIGRGQNCQVEDFELSKFEAIVLQDNKSINQRLDTCASSCNFLSGCRLKLKNLLFSKQVKTCKAAKIAHNHIQDLKSLISGFDTIPGDQIDSLDYQKQYDLEEELMSYQKYACEHVEEIRKNIARFQAARARALAWRSTRSLSIIIQPIASKISL